MHIYFTAISDNNSSRREAIGKIVGTEIPMKEYVKTIPVPRTYVTRQDSHIRVSNYPESASEVTAIQIVTLNRPEKLNAITDEMINTLADLWTTYDVDDRVKVIILTGAGNRAFSAGIDLTLDVSGEKNRPVRDLRDPGGTLALAMFNCSKTIIVAYNGLSVGIGMTSTLAAAIRYVPSQMKYSQSSSRTSIASVKSEFGFPFARIGLTMESCSSFFLPRMVGYSNATYLLATGKRYPADANVLNGIFAELLPEPEQVLPRAIEIAEDIVKNVSTMAIHLNRQMIWRNASSAEAAHLMDSPLLMDMFGGQ